jgi:hypothetical protein
MGTRKIVELSENVDFSPEHARIATQTTHNNIH